MNDKGALILISIAMCLFSLACSTTSEISSSQYFRPIPTQKSNLLYTNSITETPNFNYFTYPFIYFGGGVALGDINNDNLPDIFFTGNMVPNALFLNRGGLKFEEITRQAGVGGPPDRWATGVTMADINNDGYLDIYVSVSGPGAGKNLLYINNRDATFTERAEEYGIADGGYSMQSVFFDYDRDGDLDLYVGNYRPTSFRASNEFYENKVNNPEAMDTDRLYRNDHLDRFTDVTTEAGIMNFGLTLGLSASDFNNDGWMDIYVSNDLNSPDYLYINNGNNTFTNKIKQYTRHTSNFGMGTDAADINNDGLPDLIQLDMMSRSNQQQKANMSAMAPKQFYDLVGRGFPYQYMKNTLQLNTGLEGFGEISELAGVANTDWSWGALLFDMDNDGYKDLYVTNGIRRNVNDNDFNAYLRIQNAYGKIAPNRYMELLGKMPVVPTKNYAYRNNGDLTFSRLDNGLGLEGFSNGVSYGDLDLDGDLDVVVNNLDQQSVVFENVSGPNANFLRVKLKGTTDNTFGIGAKVMVFVEGKVQHQELVCTRGYQSSVENVLHFGLGKHQLVDSVLVTWPDGTQQIMDKVEVNQMVTIDQKRALVPIKAKHIAPAVFETFEPDLIPRFEHQENEFNDFDREILLPHRMSRFGPALAVADVNEDGLDDFFVGGAKGFASKVYLQNPNGTFSESANKSLEADKLYEDVDAIFFDANNDGFLDLYVVSGGGEWPEAAIEYQDRLYLNVRGSFERHPTALPALPTSGSSVVAEDFDQDGDLDLFVGGRHAPGKYPFPVSSYLLENTTTGENVRFVDSTPQKAPMLTQIGMVTDADWADVDADGWVDLIIVGEWMNATILKNDQGILKDLSSGFGLSGQTGWWNCIKPADLDGDGDIDLIAGNLGLNYKYKANNEEPFEVYAYDFDANQRVDIALGYYNDNQLYPVRGRECTSQQIPSIKKKFPNYTEFSKASFMDVYPRHLLDSSLHYKANTFSSTVFINEGSKFIAKPLENEMQISSINSIVVEDFNGDGKLDLLVGGNLYQSEVETARSDAGHGILSLGNGDGSFKTVPQFQSGLGIDGEVRQIEKINLAKNRTGWLVARNNQRLILITHTKGD